MGKWLNWPKSSTDSESSLDLLTTYRIRQGLKIQAVTLVMKITLYLVTCDMTDVLDSLFPTKLVPPSIQSVLCGSLELMIIISSKHFYRRNKNYSYKKQAPLTFLLNKSTSFFVKNCALLAEYGSSELSRKELHSRLSNGAF